VGRTRVSEVELSTAHELLEEDFTCGWTFVVNRTRIQNGLTNLSMLTPDSLKYSFFCILKG